MRFYSQINWKSALRENKCFLNLLKNWSQEPHIPQYFHINQQQARRELRKGVFHARPEGCSIRLSNSLGLGTELCGEGSLSLGFFYVAQPTSGPC